ncbi:MAG: hypothetical protein A3F10_00290 [Coxiella sp. RIFCSPHIGHO2_12_FULL_42_15]|nr:MAG: hypothetical protein A3F10_00290 [Coxiella sp. RIFCSPHIGHO2_12_FULL_42_15]
MKSKLCVISIGLFLGIIQITSACTSFIQNGSSPSNSTPILTKVRDTAYSVAQGSFHKEDLRFFRNSGVYAYIAVMFGQQSSQGARNFISVGTNEKGLSVALNFATSESSLIKQLYGSIAQQESDIIKEILQKASTVQEAQEVIHALNKSNALVPCLLSLSDSQNGLIAEIAVDTNKNIHYEFKSSISSNNALYVTNHFDTSTLVNYNQVISIDSSTRYDRIKQLMNDNAGQQYTVPKALTFAKDYNDGELNSVFRNASRMSYVVQGGQQQSTLFIEFTNTAQLYNRALLVLDQNFWSSHKDGDVIIDADKSFNPGKKIEKFLTY